MINIPMRPDGSVDVKITEANKDIFTWYVLSGCGKVAAVKLFDPSIQSLSPLSQKKAAERIFSNADAIAYIEAYKETLKSFLGDKQEESTPVIADDLKEKKKRAISKLTEFVLNQADHIEHAEDPEDVLKYAERLGLLGEEKETIEVPRRYLPEHCDTCEYKIWIDTNCNISED